jgi:hypothetical protein
MTDEADVIHLTERRNRDRKAAGLPLIDVEAELQKARRQAEERAFCAFKEAWLKPFLEADQHYNKPPTSWSEAMGRQGRYRKIEDRELPAIQKAWDDMKKGA